MMTTQYADSMDVTLTQEKLEKLEKLEQYIHKYYPTLTGNHFTTLVDIIFMATIRLGIDMDELLRDLYNGILNIDKFNTINNGNIYDFIDPKYIPLAKRIKDINVGSNGGMASIGKGEWIQTLFGGINKATNKPKVSIIKNGRGDIQYLNKYEEVKWNGGKVDVNKPGNQVNEKFKSLVQIKDKVWVPFRVKDKNKFSEKEIMQYNAKYWQAISEEENELLSDDELKNKIIIMSFKKVFEKSHSFIMFNDDGKYQRFYNIEEVQLYYKDKIHLVKFEIRAKWKNPPAMYCDVY